MAAQSAGNLVFHAVVGRLLEPDSYGALGAVLATMVMVGIPLGALQTAASQHVATHGLSRASAHRALLAAARWTLAPALVTLACAPLLSDYFHLSGPAESVQLAPYLLVAAVLATARGLLLGAGRVGTVAATYLISTGVRLVLGVALVVPLGVAGALTATLLGEAVALAVAMRPYRRKSQRGDGLGGGRGDGVGLGVGAGCHDGVGLGVGAGCHDGGGLGAGAGRGEGDGRGDSGGHGQGGGRGRGGDGGEGAPLRLGAVWGAGVAVTGLFLFSSVDLLLARHHLGGAASGSYVAAATVAKTVLALPAGIMSVVFPRLVAGWKQPGRGGVLTGAATAVVVPAVVGAAVVVAAPALVLAVLYGSGYGEDAGLVRMLAAVAGLTSVVTVLTNAALARRSGGTLIPWAGAALEVALIEAWHDSAAQIAACSAGALVPTLLAILVVEGRAWWRSSDRSDEGLRT